MKNAVFGHTSFIKVVINGTITNNRSQTPHDSIENTEDKAKFILKTSNKTHFS